MWLALFLGSLHIVSDLLCALRENKTVRGMGPKPNNIYTVGTRSLQIVTFKTTMHLQGVLDEIMCRAFPTTLKGPARVWFYKIPPNTVSSFKELSKQFYWRKKA